MVLTPPRQADREVEPVIRQLTAHGVSVVLLTRYLDEVTDLDYVGADNQRIGFEATQHLIQLGAAGASAAHSRAPARPARWTAR